MSDLVRVTVQAGVMTITLARPDKKNALTDAMYQALHGALTTAETDDAIRVVLFAADGEAFCAGNDIADFMQVATGARDLADAHVFRFISALAQAKKPVVAAVQGLGVGIGLTMLLHCDLVYIAEDARLTAPFVNLGLSPEAASSRLLPALIGQPRAFALFALGEAIIGAEAVALGLANAALPRDQVLPRAMEAARALAARAPGALRVTKALMRDTAAIDAQITAENAAFALRLQSAEAREAFAAFLERRPPVF